MFVKSLTAENFRSFKELKVEFEHPEIQDKRPDGFLKNVNLLLGINGAGKTTVLKALALAVLSPVIQESGYKPYYLVRRTPEGHAKSTNIQCVLGLHGQDIGGKSRQIIAISEPSARIEMRGNYERIAPDRTLPHVDLIFEDESPAFFLLGYGATRRVENVEHLDSQMRKRRGLRYQRVAGLFEEYITLFPMGGWLPELKSASKARYQEVESLLSELLPEDTWFTGRFEDYEPIFKHGSIELPFGALSDGYRSYIGLVADIIYNLHSACPKSQTLTDVSGSVLVDDIDLNLHPSWQRTVVPTLARTFPRLQLVLTTHSPIVAGTIHAKNVRVVEDREVKEYQERVHGLSADQILTGSYFNLASARSPEAEKKLTELAREVAQHGDPKDAIAFLSELAGNDSEDQK